MNANINDFIGVFEKAYCKEFCLDAIDFFENLNAMGAVRNRQQEDLNVLKINKDDQFVFTTGPVIKEVNLQGKSAELMLELNRVFWKECYSLYAEKYGVLKTSGNHSSYIAKVQKTDVGAGYHIWHFEASNKETANRLLFWILYLNDVEEGGETEFLYYPKRIKAKEGTLLIAPAAFSHTHRGNPPISNTKYIITGWVEY